MTERMTETYPPEHDPRTFTGEALYVIRYVREVHARGRYNVGRMHGPYDEDDARKALEVAAYNVVHGSVNIRPTQAVGTKFRGRDAYVCTRDEDDETEPVLFLIISPGIPPWYVVSIALRPRHDPETGQVIYPDTMPHEDSDMDGDES